MPVTPDDLQGGTADADKLILNDIGLTADVAGEVVYRGGEFLLRDSLGVFNPRDVDEATHEGLDTLVHGLAEDSYDEVTFSGNNISNVTTWTDITQTTKIRELQVTYTGGRITQIVEIQYDPSGVEAYRITETVAYVLPTGNRVESITRVRS